MEVSFVKIDLPSLLMYAIPEISCFKMASTSTSVSRCFSSKIDKAPCQHNSMHRSSPSISLLLDRYSLRVLGWSSLSMISISLCYCPPKLIKILGITFLTAIGFFSSLSHPKKTLPQVPPPRDSHLLQEYRSVICVQF